jgi:hypothetical protein
MNRVHLLHHAHKRCWLAFAYVRAYFTHLSQAATEVITPVTKIEFRPDIDHIAWPQLWHAPRIAFGLNFAEAGFAGASVVSSRESTSGFGALVRLAHIFMR